jgi:DNA-binding response OmpR family regulator
LVRIWSDENVSSIDPAIKNAVARIRKKSGSAKIIENVYNAGYRFPSNAKP